MSALASIDGYDKIQENMIKNVARIISFSPNLLQEIVDQLIDNSTSNYSGKDPYEVLGCLRNDTFEQIKKRYRELVKKFHPDFIQSQNLDDEFVQFATEKMKEINSAYEQIKKEKNV